MITTLNKIRAYEPCASGWQTLLTNLEKVRADDEPLSIATIFDSNGLADALWCLRAVEGHDREIRLFAVWCARQVQHLMADPRSLAALDVAERFANGEAGDAELIAAGDAARDASWAAANAAWAARNAAWAAANAARAAAGAAGAASWAAANTARAAAGAASWAAARAAMDAAGDAVREAQAVRLREVCAEIERGKK